MSFTEANNILQELAKRPMVADGAMGTLLYTLGVKNSCFESLNVSDRAVIEAVHLDYLRAGADIIRTNTFAANGLNLAHHGLADKVWNINVHGVKIARAARDIAGRPTYVAGSIGPIEINDDNTDEAQLQAIFREQAEGLLAGGIDIFWLETFADAKQAIIAVQVIRNIARLPVALHFSFGPDAMTAKGQSPAEVGEILRQAGTLPDVIGVNCGAGPTHALLALEQLRKALPEQKLWSVLPNAGLPLRVSGRPVFTTAPAYMADMLPQMLATGARVVGGCCGTEPSHIAALRIAMDQQIARSEQTRVSVVDTIPATNFSDSSPTRFGTAYVSSPTVTMPTQPVASATKSNCICDLHEIIGKEFVISVELDPPKGANITRILMGAQRLKEAGAHAINVADSPMARVRMDAVATSALIQQETGLQVITHMTTRDRNLMGLQSNLLGAQALGIRSILGLTGDSPSLGNVKQATAVYDVDAIGLIKMAHQLNQGKDMNGNPVGDPTSLFIGCALSPNHPDLPLELQRFHQKVEAGANFVMTQPLYNRESLDRVLNELGGSPIPMLLGVMPLHSYKQAHYLHNEVPGIDIPESVRDALQKAGNDGLRVGLDLAMELIIDMKKDVAGVYIVPSFGKYEEIGLLVEQIRKLIG